MKYTTAQICKNGHIITSNIEHEPEKCEKFCQKCGAETIISCPSCGEPIRGDREYLIPSFDGNIKQWEYLPIAPSYCINCGNPYPWTTSALNAAKMFIEESTLSSDDKEIFNNNVKGLISDTPNTKLSAMRIHKILEKTDDIVKSSIKEVLITVVSEGVKKILWP